MIDVVIIGSGAGGGPLALAVSQAGCSVLVLEKGAEYQRKDYIADEVEMTRRNFWTPALTDEMHTLLEAGSPMMQPTYLGWIGQCVGGGTVQMAGYLYRLHPDDFRLKSRFGEYEAIADWPYDYDDLEPYYTRAEWELGISGSNGSHPGEGWRSKAYPMPPLDTHPLTEHLDQACERLGWHAFPTPRAIASRPYKGRPACTYCGFCAGYGCRTGAKSSSQEALLPRAVATGNCEIRSRTMVREITIGADGRATGCVYLDDDGQEHQVKAKVVCVCCSAVESARLLLLSKSSTFPDGLANSNGGVGRHLQFHGFSNGQGRFQYDRHPDKPLRHSHPFLERSLMDHYFLPDGVSDLAKGGLIRFGLPSANPIAAALRAAENRASLHENGGGMNGGGVVWGDELMRRISAYFHDYRLVDFEVFHDFIPNDRTHVDLDPQVTDRWGLPVARIHLDNLAHHQRAGDWLVSRGLDVLDAMGADELLNEEAGEVAPFLVHGTCRAGNDPATSVVNPYCQAHEVNNLFVVDGSFMPTSGGVPPTLTIVANSFRTADHIIDRARSGELG